MEPVQAKDLQAPILAQATDLYLAHIPTLAVGLAKVLV